MAQPGTSAPVKAPVPPNPSAKRSVDSATQTPPIPPSPPAVNSHIPSPHQSPSSDTHSPANLLDRLQVLFLSIIPSILFGVLGLMLDEAARFFNYAALVFHRKAASSATVSSKDTALECDGQGVQSDACLPHPETEMELTPNNQRTSHFQGSAVHSSSNQIAENTDELAMIRAPESNILETSLPKELSAPSLPNLALENVDDFAPTPTSAPGMPETLSFDEPAELPPPSSMAVENAGEPGLTKHHVQISEPQERKEKAGNSAVAVLETDESNASHEHSHAEISDQGSETDSKQNCEHEDAPENSERTLCLELNDEQSLSTSDAPDDSYNKLASGNSEENNDEFDENQRRISRDPESFTQGPTQSYVANSEPFPSVPPPPPYSPPAEPLRKPEMRRRRKVREKGFSENSASGRVSGDPIESSTKAPAVAAGLHGPLTLDHEAPSNLSTQLRTTGNDTSDPSPDSSISANKAQTTLNSSDSISLMSGVTTRLDQKSSSATSSMVNSSDEVSARKNHELRKKFSGTAPNLVTKRVSAYETFLASTEAEINSAIKLPMPASPVLSSTFTSGEIATSPRKRNGSSQFPSTRSRKLTPTTCTTKSTKSQDEISMVSTGELSGRLEDEDADEDGKTGFTAETGSMTNSNTQGSGSSKVTVSEGLGCPSEPRTHTQLDVADAPPGAQSLRELIPEVVPGVNRNQSPSSHGYLAEKPRHRDFFRQHSLDNMPEISLDDDTIIRVESMEKLPSFSLSRQGSLASFQTESYSSPESPNRRSPGHAGDQTRHRDSWRASDHDMFSEDPMTESKTAEDRTYSKKTNKTPNAVRDGDFDSLIDGTRFENSLIEDYDSAKMVVGVRRAESRRSTSSDSAEGEAHIATPFVKPADRSSWQRRAEALDYVQSHYTAETNIQQESDGIGIAGEQCTTESGAMNSSRVSDRERAKRRERSLISRFSPSKMSSRVYLTSVAGQPPQSSAVGRSISASDGRYDDWPEYGQSTGDNADVGPRHRSDISTGASARRKDLLPFELLHGHTLSENSPYTDRDLPLRFRSARRGWLRLFGRSTAAREAREANDVRDAVKNILRLGRRPLITDESIVSDGGNENNYGRPMFEKPNRRSTSGASDYRFDIDIRQEDVYSLLIRLCPECEYNVVIRRPTYKLKVEMPCEGTRVPMFVSISLSRPQGRGTTVSLCRSRDDQSGGPVKLIEAAGANLKMRLSSHVEFIEDSFADLYLQDSAIHLETGKIARR